MSSLVAKANALKAELSLPVELSATKAVAAACEVMQIVAEPGESLPSLADRVVAAVGCGRRLQWPFFLSRHSWFGDPLFLMLQFLNAAPGLYLIEYLQIFYVIFLRSLSGSEKSAAISGKSSQDTHT